MRPEKTKRTNLSETPKERRTSNDEQTIYDHLISLVQVESPSQMIDRFRKLFIDGMGYPEMEIEAALYRIIAFLDKDEDFNHLLSRSCYILINRWQVNSKNRSAIAQLIASFQNSSTRFREIATRSRLVQRLQELVINFTRTEEYIVLQRLAVALHPTAYSSNRDTNASLGKLISRYPFLYPHCLLPEDSSCEQSRAIAEIQAERQQQFEVNISQYILYLLRQVKNTPTANSKNGDRAIKPVANPTLLSDEKFQMALKEFVGKVKESYSYRDLAQDFLLRTRQIKTYRDFKLYLYEYLIDSVDPRYGKHQFNERLYKYINNICPESDSQKLDDFLIVRTCSELFNFLVESPENPNYYLFIDMISNLGTTKTIALLLKIVLLSSQVKPHLEKRFSILFSYYESQTAQDIRWLVQSLENLNLALVVNFGNVDVSLIKNNY